MVQQVYHEAVQGDLGDYCSSLNRGKPKWRGRDLSEEIRFLPCKCAKSDVRTASTLGGAFQFRKHHPRCKYKWACEKLFLLLQFGAAVGGLAVFERMPEDEWSAWYKKAQRNDERLIWNVTHKIRVGEEIFLLGPVNWHHSDTPPKFIALVPITPDELAGILVAAAQNGLTGRMIETIGRVTAKTLVGISKGKENKDGSTSSLFSTKSRFLQTHGAAIEKTEDLFSHIGLGFEAFDDYALAKVKSNFRRRMRKEALSVCESFTNVGTVEEAKGVLDDFWKEFQSRTEKEADERRRALGIPFLWPKPPFALPNELAEKAIERREKRHPQLWSEIHRVEAHFALETYTPAAVQVERILDQMPPHESALAISNPSPDLKAALEAKQAAAKDLGIKISQLHEELDRCGSLEEQANHLSWYLDG